MSYYREVHLYCDHLGCRVELETAPELGFPTLSVMRREATKAGWIKVRSPLGRRFDKDYCPEHREVHKPEVRAKVGDEDG
ncbi:MAG TPA: hypothetical protein VHZ03_32690 [Trebonia sp.]|nr:hypothetical protein [Trebonia sp.]